MLFLSMTIKIAISTEIKEIKDCIPLIEWVINQQELHDFILDFKNSYNENKFLQNENTTFWRLKRFVSNSTTQNGICYWNFDVMPFRSETKITGYIDSHQNKVYINTFHLNRPIHSICKTLIHEYCHIVGMTHSMFEPKKGVWKETAPYAISEYAEYLIANKMGISIQKPKVGKKNIFQIYLYKIFGFLS